MKSIQTQPLDLSQIDDLCKKVAQETREGDVFALSGELGAGKTTFVSLLSKHLGLKPGQLVSSPTYVIHHIYDAKFPIHHIDFYRMETSAQIEGLGFEEFLGKYGVTFIEWFEKFPNVWTGPYVEINIDIVQEDMRTYTFMFHGPNTKRFSDLSRYRISDI